ncbi:ABC [Ectocarpus sp. CCAP 1310/34]|nr:ABC [Ectocarpus sp. CCAP 1310/34]
MMMMAKKRKGPAADALAQLEALEAELEPVSVDVEGSPPPLPKQKKNKKKKGPKGAAADALAQLEELEAEGESLPPYLRTSIAWMDIPAAEAAATAPPAEHEVDRKEAREAEVEVNLLQPPPRPKKGKKKRGAGGIEERLDDFKGEGDEKMVDHGPSQEETATPKEAEVGKETLESKIRKSRPPPRVRISSSSQPGFVSLRLEGVAVTFRNQEVVKDATWDVKTGDRIGLVGPNGGGKTTQVKILAGDLEPTAGEVIKSSKDLRVAFLRQEFVDELVMERSLKDELISVFTEEAAILAALQRCEDPAKMEGVLNRLSNLQEDAERNRVYDLSTKVQRVMDLMGFQISEGEQPVSSFSGGWRMRIGLGKILLKDPNILLLDEPTNHLDMESVEWLESFLQNQNLPMVIVSHDREFLDRVCTGIVDTDGGVAVSYPGNYSNFIKLKRARLESWQASYKNQQKKIKEERNWINKFKSKGAWAAQVKSRQKALDKLIASDDFVKQPPNMGKPFRFRFPPAPRMSASEEVVSANGVSHGYNGRRLFSDVNLVVEKGERIAFLGPNGAGKSTLLRLVVGQEEPEEGSCRLGSGVVKQYFEQNQADVLDLSLTVIETLMKASTGEKYEDLRKLLGQFLFKGDAVDKSVEQLSGGEKARVSLCKMMLTPANLLVLDEPTNHLDIPAKEMLEEALQHYEGSVLVVSHDRYFVSQVATTICNLEEEKLVRYDGDYRYFLESNGNILEKVESRYVAGLSGIQKAKRVDLEEMRRSKKSFGGKGGPSGRKDKGVKNAKRNTDKVF